jgi:DNA processing protein
MSSLQPNLKYWLATTYLLNIDSIRWRKLLAFCGGIETVFSASITTLQAGGLNEKQAHSIKQINWQAIEKDLVWCEKNHADVLIWTDDHYPKLLREIPDPPLVLYTQGKIELLNLPQLAIVGSRHGSVVGLENAQQFAYILAQAGLIITSGLALGIDTASHQGALAATGLTIGVMGTGLGHIYPRSNSKLAEQIKSAGVLVSEFPPHTLPKAHHFPLRNRIISGLSLGVLVVEATLRSGSLITARNAVEQGRDVFAMPGSIHHPLAKGCHYLIRQGAKLVENTEDILLELAPLLEWVCKNRPKVSSGQGLDKNLDELQQVVLTQIGYESTALDTIVARSGLTQSLVSSMLLSLELMGYINIVSGGYSRTSQ